MKRENKIKSTVNNLDTCLCQVHHTQAAVCTPHQYQHPGHDPHLWRDSKCHQKGTLEACGGVPRS